ncbi:MAG: hypothetical protein KA251_11450 [Saprospiraceae bacterium]|nr:hypothetical protein [Candidatus Vicinibacter affinis]MBK7799214.1 hypothetical protein [Candidatus Vicinibacter affinis]MBP6523601.1 hypothetical protein [Saprospiraceae bacterium]
MDQNLSIETKKTIDQELEIILLSELFDNLQHYASMRHDDLSRDLESACKEWVKNCPHSAERAINLMGTFIPLLGQFARVFDLISDKAQYYSKLSDQIGR